MLGGTEDDYADAAAAVDVSANRVVFELTGDDAAACWRTAARSTST